MLVDLTVGAAEPVLPPDSGSLRADLTSFVGAAIEALEHPLVARIGAELLAESARNPALAEAIATRFRDPRRAAGQEMLARAVARGEVPAGADVEIALDLLAGPLVMRSLPTGGGFEACYATRLVDAVLNALSATS
jgi:hypothetical protein